MLHVIGCITTKHDMRLVALALVVCGFASLATVQMLARAQAAHGKLRWAWLGAGGVAFGSGVWVTHFVAMMAYRPDLPIRFALGFTAVSLLVAIAGGWLALWLATVPGQGAAIGAGLLLGATIGAMHFTGMAAMAVPGIVGFSAIDVDAAWITGLVFGLAAMLRFRDGHPWQSASCLVLAVVGLHFTAMAAVSILPDGHVVTDTATPELAIAVAAVGLLILMASLGGALLDRHLERRTARESERFRSFADATFEGLFFLDGETVDDANSVLCRMLDRPAAEIVGAPVTLFFAPEGHAALHDLCGQSGGSIELVMLDRSGGRHVVDVLARPLDGSAVTVIAVRDASERKRAESRIQELAHIDALTGLANRLLLRDRLAQALAIAERSENAVALFRIDMDRFKTINELLGQQAGDTLLIEAARRLRVSVRETDTVARLDGDEFIVVQPFESQPESAHALGQHLLRVLAEPYPIDGQEVELTASIGISIYPTDGDDAETLLKHTDLALHRAKQEGRCFYRFFEPLMDSKLRAQLELEQDLRQALAQGELHLVYQPVVEGDLLTVAGYEVLLRWRHPRRGAVPPDQFIPLAEENGAILAIGGWVLETACAEAASWPEPHTIAVNLSPAQFRNQDLVEQVRDILGRTGLPAGRLELEVTEGVLMDDTERSLTVLRGLKAQGIRIALDDFGTGYSSLSYLRRFPFDRLKIDRSFVAELGIDPDADAIVSCIMAMSRSLRLEVTAEGVETDMQLRLLRWMQCGHLQGYLLGRPVPASEIVHAPPRRVVAA